MRDAVDGAPARSARSEWAQMWPVPLTGLVGVVACSSFSYSYGVFMIEMTREFGWTRTEFSSTYLLQSLVGLIAGPVVGRLTDRFGSRRVALFGIAPFVLTLSLLGMANSSLPQWGLLCAVFAVTVPTIGPTVWVAAVTRRFDAGRGLAMGVVLAGTGVGTGLWPLAASLAIEHFGWRLAFPIMAVFSAAVLLPLILAFIRDDRLPARALVDKASAPQLLPILRSWTFICLIVAGGLFVIVTYGVTLHLVPMLTANGFSPTMAASAAVIAGVTMLIGRIGTGWLLDRFPTRTVAVIAFLLPVVEMLCLWQGKGSVPISLIGVALLGISTGAESDVLVYIASRRFPNSVFASAYAIISTSFAIFAGLGPLFAAALFDADGDYTFFYLLCIPLTIAATVLVASVPEKDPALEKL